MIKTSINTLLFVALAACVYGQKLNTIQEGGFWAPANVKVDAKVNDWYDTYQAYNKTTDIYYTMANDNTNLYLVVKSVSQSINNKIMGGGITIAINTSGKKKEKDAYVITFPVVNLANLRSQIMQGMRGGSRGGQPLDSAAIAGMRKKAISMAKEIKLIGFKDVQDSVISVYNEYGIKAIVDFNDKGDLIMEMAMPLKYMHLAADNSISFAYNIKLNGIQINSLFPGAGAFANGGGGGGGGGFGGGGGGFGGGGFGGGMPPGGGGASPGMTDFANMLTPTDFWGKYTMAKK